MGCFAPDSVPVLSTLARQFAVFDHWFCSVPSQTFCNRSFFHAASSTNLVINAPYSDWVKGNDAETVFDRMNASKVSWKVYYDKEDVFPVTAAIHFPRLKTYVPTNFHNMDQFYDDVAAGNLPSYSFIEPRMFYDHNDQHPPAVLQGHVLNSSVLAGEQLINNIYDAIRTSNSARGSNYQNTVLIITYDEHGGCYDHVPPPPAVPPDASSAAGQMDFRFDRLGVRVPTVIVSAWTEPGTIVSAPVHHNSVLKTMSMKWNLGRLTARDATAPDFLEALNRKSPRGSAEWPSITARPWTNPPKAANSDHPLNGLQRGVLGLILQVVKEQDLTAGRIMTVAEAIYYMRKNLPAK
jgi:phospholipase C